MKLFSITGPTKGKGPYRQRQEPKCEVVAENLGGRKEQDGPEPEVTGPLSGREAVRLSDPDLEIIATDFPRRPEKMR